MKLIIAFILLTGSLAQAQKKKVPEENAFDFNHKNDTIPFFKFEREELDTFISVNAQLPPEMEAFGINYSETIGFKIDRTCKLIAYNHYKADIIMPFGKTFKNNEDEQTLRNKLRRESERILKLSESLWFSDSIREKNDIVLKIKFKTKEVTGKTGNVIVILPRGNNAVYNAGVRKFAARKTLLAKIYFEEAVKNSPKDPDANYNLATCYVKLKDNTKACEHFKKCAELGDKTVQADIDKYCK